MDFKWRRLVSAFKYLRSIINFLKFEIVHSVNAAKKQKWLSEI